VENLAEVAGNKVIYIRAETNILNIHIRILFAKRLLSFYIRNYTMKMVESSENQLALCVLTISKQKYHYTTAQNVKL